MNALILKGADAHTYRLEQGLTACGVKTFTVEHFVDIPSNKYDLAFVDPSFPYDVGSKINAERIMFFDCEDDPFHFDPGEAYESLKDSCEYYAKMNYVDQDHRKDGIKNIAIPLNIFSNAHQVAGLQVPDFTFRNSVPYLVAAPTYLGRYSPIEGVEYSELDGVSALGKHDGPIEDDASPWMYNQRIDWLLSLRKNNVFHVGGLVFKEHNMTEEWQSKYFGNVGQLGTPAITWQQHIQNLFNYRVALCPTGHERISWRTFDIMATGAILFLTDVGDRRMLYMPKEYIKVKDGEDIATKILDSQKDFYNIWEASQENRRLFADLTPEKVIEDFMEQMK